MAERQVVQILLGIIAYIYAGCMAADLLTDGWTNQGKKAMLALWPVLCSMLFIRWLLNFIADVIIGFTDGVKEIWSDL